MSVCGVQGLYALKEFGNLFQVWKFCENYVSDKGLGKWENFLIMVNRYYVQNGIRKKVGGQMMDDKRKVENILKSFPNLLKQTNPAVGRVLPGGVKVFRLCATDQ